MLTLTLRQTSQQRIDVSALLPETLIHQSLEAIAAMTLPVGNRAVPVGDIFSLEGDTQSLDTLVFQGETASLDAVGKGLREGTIEVKGDAGSYLGMQMRGGTIRVSGSIDAYGACELKNGFIEIRGNAGDFLGASQIGNLKGMSGGVVLVRGNAGDRVGDHMRRGIILIEGGAGAYLGARMTAGTIVVRETVGPFAGYAMGRGTLLLAKKPQSILPTFQDCGYHTLGFIPLLLKSLRTYDTVFTDCSDSLKRVQRFAGDFASLGKGEILVALPPSR
jgi:formylmethanofuran dehydrogenase subunit C